MPFLQVEGPGAVLLGQQRALQPVGQARDHVGQAGELLVEIGAQPRQLLGVAQLLGRRPSRRRRWRRPCRAARAGRRPSTSGREGCVALADLGRPPRRSRRSGRPRPRRRLLVGALAARRSARRSRSEDWPAGSSPSPSPSSPSPSSGSSCRLGLVVAGLVGGVVAARSPISRSRRMARAMRAKAAWSSMAAASRSRSGAGLGLDLGAQGVDQRRGRRRAAASPVSRSRTIRPMMSASGGAAPVSARCRPLRSTLAFQGARAGSARTPPSALAPMASMRACSIASNTAGAWASAGRRRAWAAGVVVGEAQRHLVGQAADARRVLARRGRAAGGAGWRGCRPATGLRRRTPPPGPASRPATARRGPARA